MRRASAGPARLYRRLALLAVYVLAALLVRSDAGAERELPAYGADVHHVTVSGLSSGAYMAGQFALVYSSIVSGVGLVAGGPYYCAGYEGREPFIPYLLNAMGACMNPAEAGVDPPDAAVLWQRTQEFARAGLVDDVANLRGQAVYLFSGRNDHTVTKPVVDQARRFHGLTGSARILFRDDVEAGHGMVTDNGADQPCAYTAPPYLNNCHLPLAQEMLRYLIPGLRARAERPTGAIVRFDQRRYALYRTSMEDDGYAYIPQACQRLSCRVHIAFHGCRQGASSVGDRFYAHAGYNALADANNLIVLYPQVGTSWFYPYNPRGCWDFWGYSSGDPFFPDFYTRYGSQLRAVRAMLDRLSQAPP